MLILISDLHLNDGSEDTNIPADAFDVFRDSLLRVVKAALPAGKDKLAEIELVFLGDVLDVIHSSTWLPKKAGKEGGLRPWKGTPAALVKRTEQILKEIGKANNACSQKLAGLRSELEARADRVVFTYVTGNHDRLLCSLESEKLRQAAIDFLHLTQDAKDKFPRHLHRPNYAVYARHGDVHDNANWDGETQNSCLGDAVVIELLCRFIQRCEEAFPLEKELIEDFREIYNVRPLTSIPAWVYGACRRCTSDHVEHIVEPVKEAWNDCLRQFLKDQFVQKHDKKWKADLVDALEFGSPLSAVASLPFVSNVLDWYRGDDGAKYAAAAAAEQPIHRGTAQYVVYGHTHDFQVLPLDDVAGRPLIYFNTGTWKHVQQRTVITRREYEFVSWNTMTYVTFYDATERSTRPFEVWHGILARHRRTA